MRCRSPVLKAAFPLCGFKTQQLFARLCSLNIWGRTLCLAVCTCMSAVSTLLLEVFGMNSAASFFPVFFPSAFPSLTSHIPFFSILAMPCAVILQGFHLLSVSLSEDPTTRRLYITDVWNNAPSDG